VVKPISIIIPNWNGEKQLKKNLPLLFNVLAKFEGKSEVIIVDDKSTDDSLKTIKNLKLKLENSMKIVNCKLKIIINNINSGFARSVNRGVKVAQYNIVFLLNTDVEVKDGCFDYLLPNFDDPNVFAVGANADWTLGIGRFINGYLDISSPKKVKKNIKEAQISFWVSGGHAAFDRQKWIKLGGIDTLYAPFYFEETDLCYRAWKRGYKVLWEPKARVLHKHEESVIRKHFSPKYVNFIAQRNQLIFVWKNITNPRMVLEHKKALIKRIRKNPKYLKVVFAAVVKLLKIIKKRKIEKKEAKIGDRKIFRMF